MKNAKMNSKAEIQRLAAEYDYRRKNVMIYSIYGWDYLDDVNERKDSDGQEAMNMEENNQIEKEEVVLQRSCREYRQTSECADGMIDRHRMRQWLVRNWLGCTDSKRAKGLV